jgi:uncharacterized membrane protein (DUF441 family)
MICFFETADLSLPLKNKTPTRFLRRTTMMKITMGVDRGNGACKIAATMNEVAVTPFKLPSVIRKVTPLQSGVTIGSSTYLCGLEAIAAEKGSVSTPLTTQDKVVDLSVVVAKAISLICTGSDRDIQLSIAVSSPFATDSLKKEIVNELKKLKSFTVDGDAFTCSVVAVSVAFEGAILLDANPSFNAVLDIGFGTMLAAYRHVASGEVRLAPQLGGDIGGVNVILKAFLNDPLLLKALKSMGATSPPSVEVLAARLSQGQLGLKGLDIAPLLLSHMAILRTRLENAAQSIKSDLRLSNGWETEQEPKIALIGGGAALLKACIGIEKLAAWAAKHNISLVEYQPDYQTALVLHQIADNSSVAV